MLKIGLTGGIGSGKTLVANHFAQLGAALIDADLLAHALTAPNGAAMPQIVAVFGSTFLTPSGAMDRAKMRHHVFTHPEARIQLEGILHPLIRAAGLAALHQIEATAQAPYLIEVIPLLLETQAHVQGRLDRIVVVDCPEETQISRVMQRNGLPRDDVIAILASQAERSARLAIANDIIDNSGSTEATRTQIALLHHRYLLLASRS